MNPLLGLWMTYPILTTYLILINFLALFIYGADKLFARAEARRVRERTLLLLALFGGSLGALIGMNLLHHKTRKVSFQMLFVVILLIQMAILWWAFNINPTPWPIMSF